MIVRPHPQSLIEMGLCILLTGVGQVYAAETVNVTGEVIDTYCYGLMGASS